MYIYHMYNENLDIYEKSTNDIIVDLGRRFRDYRIALRLTQKELSEQSGVSVTTIVRFENGEKSAIRLDNFISLMRSIQKLEMVDELIPEMPGSLYDSTAKYGVRVKKRKNEK